MAATPALPGPPAPPGDTNALRTMRSAVGSLDGVTLPAATQLDLLAEIRALKAACAAAEAQVAITFAVDRVVESQERGESLKAQQRSATAELALAGRCSPAAMSRRLSHWRTHALGMPNTHALLREGEISEQHVTTIARLAHNLTAEQLTALDAQLAPRLSTMTVKQAEQATRRYCLDVDEETQRRRLAAAEREAHVSIHAASVELSRLSITAPTADTVAMYAALRAATECTPAGQTRGQAMAREAFLRLTGARELAEIPIEIQLVMSDTTLFGDTEAHAELSPLRRPQRQREPARVQAPDGSGACWIPATTARALALGLIVPDHLPVAEPTNETPQSPLLISHKSGNEIPQPPDNGWYDPDGPNGSPAAQRDTRDVGAERRHKGKGSTDTTGLDRARKRWRRTHQLPPPKQRAKHDGRRTPPAQSAGGAMPTARGQAELTRPQRLAEMRDARRSIRRIFTDPATGTITAVDTRRRLFTRAQRRFIIARDQVCTTPWCDAPIRHVDHATPHRTTQRSHLDDANGKCVTCNLVKETPGWKVAVRPTRQGSLPGVTTITPAGKRYESITPPALAPRALG
ncbi:DUF222 domain-containing protein [Epidermidibacterium keratini]|uniref:DUF222 domain-containing protein n=1 Tax=Epidermidibacterium keratini TaxID=1891644 RepID=A0A7L4YT31_9ACTN|nr:DUF222 domain-containing protein [Epidermidibacterium keratini]QHC01687.1 DUF222 domain-containing protein [Epidermidibacterium keratini]